MVPASSPWLFMGVGLRQLDWLARNDITAHVQEYSHPGSQELCGNVN